MASPSTSGWRRRAGDRPLPPRAFPERHLASHATPRSVRKRLGPGPGATRTDRSLGGTHWLPPREILEGPTQTAVWVPAPIRGAADNRGGCEFGAWEVEVPAMDVDTGETKYRSDPSATAVVPAVEGQGHGQRQGQLFNEPGGYPGFADTDQMPAVRGRGRTPRRHYGTPRWLRVTVALVAVAILAAGVALALVESGVIGKTTSPPADSGHTHT